MMRDLRATPVRKQSPSYTHVSSNLKCCTHVFVRHNAVKKPLQRPYDGPYKVQKHSEKHYTVDVNGRDEVISIDRLKPALQEVSPQDQVTPPLPQSTQHPTAPSSTPATVMRYDCKVHVHWPKCFLQQLPSS